MAKERTSQRNTYSKYVAPYMDTSKMVLTFSHIRYHIPSSALLQAMFNRLSGLVKEKDYNGILKALSDLEPYRINMRVSSSRKQTKEVDV